MKASWEREDVDYRRHYTIHAGISPHEKPNYPTLGTEEKIKLNTEIQNLVKNKKDLEKSLDDFHNKGRRELIVLEERLKEINQILNTKQTVLNTVNFRIDLANNNLRTLQYQISKLEGLKEIKLEEYLNVGLEKDEDYVPNPGESENWTIKLLKYLKWI